MIDATPAPMIDASYDDALDVDTLFHGAAVVIESVKLLGDTFALRSAEAQIAQRPRRSQ